MNRRFILIFTGLILLTLGKALEAQIQSPEEFLPTKYKEHFTPHHLLVDYVHYLTDKSDRIQTIEYGKTNEKRPLLLSYISTPNNLAKLEEIRKAHIAALQPNGTISGGTPAIVWLSFNVHGNEAAGAESSMQVLYDLLVSDTRAKAWLEDLVIIIDPCINPDGYSRYTHWVWRTASTDTRPERIDREHDEPWPGGRTNHYMFDLNRDWAWQSQIETQQRMIHYNKWMPHVHGDFHEMGVDDHYYFAPAAKPYHEKISDWQYDFQERVGKNIANYFDKEGWLYFTKERFDLFYPSYGDTYPMFNGAIGMTYEQAGSGRAGRSVFTEAKEELTIRERIEHHKTAALATIEAAHNNKEELKKQHKSYLGNRKDRGAYVLEDNSAGLLAEFAELMKKNNISSGYTYDGKLVVPKEQLKSTLLNVLMEKNPALEDSLTYDITSWSLPLAYGLNVRNESSVPSYDSEQSNKNNPLTKTDAKMFFLEPSGVAGRKVMGKLVGAGIKYRINEENITFEDTLLKAGSVIITQADNKRIDLSKKIAALQLMDISSLESGMALKGPDIGGDNVKFINTPNVLCLTGEEVSSYTFGQVWHFFEQVIEYPITNIHKHSLNDNALRDYNIFIIPDNYSSFSEEEIKTLQAWVRGGGKLILLGNSNAQFARNKEFGLSFIENKEETIENEVQVPYSHKQRDRISEGMPGAVIQTELDHTHPYALNMDNYHSLKTSSDFYTLEKGHTIIKVPNNYNSYGFIGSKLKPKLGGTLVLGEEKMGSGSVVYMIDNPLFRSFWKSGQYLFSNVLFN